MEFEFELTWLNKLDVRAMTGRGGSWSRMGKLDVRAIVRAGSGPSCRIEFLESGRSPERDEARDVGRLSSLFVRLPVMIVLARAVISRDIGVGVGG